MCVCVCLGGIMQKIKRIKKCLALPLYKLFIVVVIFLQRHLTVCNATLQIHQHYLVKYETSCLVTFEAVVVWIHTHL